MIYGLRGPSVPSYVDIGGDGKITGAELTGDYLAWFETLPAAHQLTILRNSDKHARIYLHQVTKQAVRWSGWPIDPVDPMFSVDLPTKGVPKQVNPSVTREVTLDSKPMSFDELNHFWHFYQRTIAKQISGGNTERSVAIGHRQMSSTVLKDKLTDLEARVAAMKANRAGLQKRSVKLGKNLAKMRVLAKQFPNATDLWKTIETLSSRAQ